MSEPEEILKSVSSGAKEARLRITQGSSAMELIQGEVPLW